MPLKHQALRAFGWSLSDKLINQLGYLAVTVYLARLIGPDSFGFIGMLTIFMLLADSVVSGGFLSALVQRSGQVTEDDACTVFWVNFGWGGAMYAVLYVAAPWIAQFYRQPQLTAIARVLFLVVIINTFTVVVRAKLTIALDFKSQAIANTIATLLSSALAVLMAQRGYGYWALVWLMVSKSLLASAGIWWFCRWLPKWRFSRASFAALFGFGSKLMLAGFVATIVNNLYVALIGRFYNATQVGFYTQATNLSNYLYQFIASSLQGVTYPIMTSIKEDRERLVSIYKQLISLTMLICLPMLIGFSAVAADFISIFLGTEWQPAVPVLVALCVARTVTPISAINMNILNAMGRSDIFLKIDLMKLPVTLSALYFAIPYGIEGIAWASVVTSFIAFFINAYYPGKMFGFGGLEQIRIAIPYIVATVIMYSVLSLLPQMPSIVALAGKIFVGVMIYGAVLWMLGDAWSKKFGALLRERFAGL
ncbi:lipopolysaccharide biosynthesis protein [Simplicispira suum]|uniref:Flippase n=1 Tax=Simplicispira suum TaxID=2109915 RepID=A0A2S0MX43_9BURK|nr:lipopolysaccharide biosynthesis protein [Simplicispira suum]AVO40460.1 flippase [Simplicispira suum]